MKDFITFTKGGNKPTVGLAISEYGFELAVVAKEAKLTLKKTCFIQTTLDEAFDVALGQQITLLDLQGATTNLLLPTQDYQILFLEKPSVPDNEIRNALKWIVADRIDFSVEQAVIDFIELPHRAMQDQADMLYVIVAKKEKITEWITRVNAAGLQVTHVDICQSALRYIALTLDEVDDAQVLLHIDEDKSFMIIFKNKVLYMMREIEIGLRQLRKGNAAYQELAMEMQRSFDYGASILKHAPISRVILTPLKEKMPNLLSFLSNTLGLPVREISFSEFLSNDLGLEQANTPFAIGAAIRQQT